MFNGLPPLSRNSTKEVTSNEKMSPYGQVAPQEQHHNDKSP